MTKTTITAIVTRKFSTLCYLVILQGVPSVQLRGRSFCERPTVDLQLLGITAPLTVRGIVVSMKKLAMRCMIGKFKFLFITKFATSGGLCKILRVTTISCKCTVAACMNRGLNTGGCREVQGNIRDKACVTLLASIMVSNIVILFKHGVLSLFMSNRPRRVQRILSVTCGCLFVVTVFL